ncbi:hypothetical protein PPERSA_00457 [Pseudocohnilembus persalinus]|uniref:Uncharacterized protein n=1 Tax=Pseudocohnilembus persalinus TaxID=266149 RepID=A0A0V0R6Y5_PSEPJ|nr:hypothetical protein PPERSA_00457 [Pseudocohnilembus persalinus]|eukprot:KRX10260.1 hypothetical protein PPERSA_00457 [Pseudocohnilembus persalinus]
MVEFNKRMQSSEIENQKQQQALKTNKVQGKILIQDHQKLQITNQIEKLVLQDKFTPIKDELVEACEIVDYAINKNIPVDAKYIYMIAPQIQLNYNYAQKQQYNEYLKYKKGLDDSQVKSSTIKVEDVYGTWGDSKEGRMGKTSQDQWKMQQQQGFDSQQSFTQNYMQISQE